MNGLHDGYFLAEGTYSVNYYHLKSILSVGKAKFSLRESSDSFFLAGEQTKPYIEPTFGKVVYETEKPAIILVSAVGATGKTALAQQLSRDTGLPMLDLSKHKPVGDNTMTGLLTRSFDVKDISGVFEGLASGKYGVIIDGADEGRAKTTEEGFEAFLDDLVKLCEPGGGTTFVILGRTEILDNCWLHFSESGVETNLITIAPFTVDDAKKYIDAFTKGAGSSFAEQYARARDFIIKKLGAAFVPNAREQGEEFVSFIGYPPVLDAVATLLNQEQNYHKLLEDLGEANGDIIEISLLHRIATYILERERKLKVVPTIVEDVMKDAPVDLRRPALEEAFSIEEQCFRLVAHCLNRKITFPSIREAKLNERYEAKLSSFLPEHPFIRGREFRNAVFEAVALATLMASNKVEAESLLAEYGASHKHSYHLVYMLDTISVDHRISVRDLNALLSAALEFRSVHAVVELRVDGPDLEEVPLGDSFGDIDIEIEILLGSQQDASKTFTFRAEIGEQTQISLGPRLAGAFVSVPCNVSLGAGHELELTAPVEVSAKSLVLAAKSLILRTPRGTDDEVIIQCERLDSQLESIITSGTPFVLAVGDMKGISYPAIQYAIQVSQLPPDNMLRQKYFRLKRILLEFRSHSRGTLAKYRHKIEHERVLKNATGRAVLDKLLADNVLSLKGNHYHLDPAGLNTHLGVTWQDLRTGQMPESLFNYLRAIR